MMIAFGTIIIIITVCSYISATSVTFIDKSTNLHHGGCLTILCQLTVLAARLPPFLVGVEISVTFSGLPFVYIHLRIHIHSHE